MIVDDNVDAAAMLAALLDLAGHTTAVAHDGPAALTLAPVFAPAVAFLDIGMPGMNGYEVARRLRALDGMPDLVLVALTGWGDAGDRARSKAAGFDHHLLKPTDLNAVHALLAAVMDRRASA
jgi:CheY-like chemotaxis protein